jgi:hypothetical protein
MVHLGLSRHSYILLFWNYGIFIDQTLAGGIQSRGKDAVSQLLLL